MNVYGYCRISTAKQSIDRQIRNIKAEYPTAHIVQEAYTGTSITRPEWLKLYRILRAGDVVVFDSVSRMSRNAEEGFALYEDLYHNDIRLVFLKEHHIDTETYKKALSGSIAMTGTNVDFILKGIIPAAQGAIEMLCHHAAEADRAAFPKDDAWAAVCTPCGFSILPEPKKPAKWKTHLRLLRQFLSTCRA